jgi:hypothetical protein
VILVSYDYSAYEDEKPAIGHNLQTVLIELADKHQAATALVEDLTTKLEAAKEELKRLSEKEIPDLLAEMRGSFTLPDGRKISVDEKIHAGLSKEREFAGHLWLEKNGYGNLMKREFIIVFDKEDEEWAKEFEQELKNRSKSLNSKTKRSIHAQTLQAWVREKMREGVDIPKDIFGVHVKRTTKISS